MSRPEPVLTSSQREKEAAIFQAIILDVVLLLFLGIMGVLSGSLTVVSEVMRGILLLIIEYATYIVLKKAHRSKFNEYEFGTGKIERITNLLVAFGLLLICLYVLAKVMSMDAAAPLSTSTLILAMIGANINLAINYYCFSTFLQSNSSEESVIVASQIVARVAKTVASAVVFGVLVLALWLSDPKAARMVDFVGSIFLVVYMLITASGLIKESLPEILDRTVPEPDHYHILRILAQFVDHYDGFSGYQARRSGKDLYIVLHLGFARHVALKEIEARLRPLRETFARELPGSILTIELEPCEIADTVCSPQPAALWF